MTIYQQLPELECLNIRPHTSLLFLSGEPVFLYNFDVVVDELLLKAGLGPVKMMEMMMKMMNLWHPYYAIMIFSFIIKLKIFQSKQCLTSFLKSKEKVPF